MAGLPAGREGSHVAGEAGAVGAGEVSGEAMNKPRSFLATGMLRITSEDFHHKRAMRHFPKF